MAGCAHETYSVGSILWLYRIVTPIVDSTGIYMLTLHMLAAFLLCRTGAYTCFNQKVGAEEYNYGSRIDHILVSGACFHHCNSVEDHSIFHCHVEDCEIMNHFKRGDSENISK